MDELTRFGIIPDVHRPYHNKKAWNLAITALKDFKPDVLIHLGDHCDFYKISRFIKDPSREFNFEAEINDCNLGLDELDEIGASRRIFIGGNHEDRLTRYLQQTAPELFGLVDVPKLLKLDIRGWEYVPYREHIKIGKLYATHDVGVAGKYAIFRAASTFQHPVVVGHTHMYACTIEGDALGKHYPAWSFGWLGDVEKVDYMHKIKVRRNWSLGFGVGFQNPANGVVHLQGIPIVNTGGYSCVVAGKEYSV